MLARSVARARAAQLCALLPLLLELPSLPPSPSHRVQDGVGHLLRAAGPAHTSTQTTGTHAQPLRHPVLVPGLCVGLTYLQSCCLSGGMAMILRRSASTWLEPCPMASNTMWHITPTIVATAAESAPPDSGSRKPEPPERQRATVGQ